MPSLSMLLRLVGVAAFSAAPVGALETTPGISTGDAIAAPPDGAFQNSGGNAEVGKGESSSTVVIGDPAAAPAVPNALSVKPVIPKNPAADALSRARALVDAAKARAQAQIDAARQHADEVVAAAHQQAADAQAHAQQQADAARAQADAASARTTP